MLLTIVLVYGTMILAYTFFISSYLHGISLPFFFFFFTFDLSKKGFLFQTHSWSPLILLSFLNWERRLIYFSKFGENNKKQSILCFYQSVSQFSCSVVSNSLRSHESQHARPSYPSPTPGVH